MLLAPRPKGGEEDDEDVAAVAGLVEADGLDDVELEDEGVDAWRLEESGEPAVEGLTNKPGRGC